MLPQLSFVKALSDRVRDNIPHSCDRDVAKMIFFGDYRIPIGKFFIFFSSFFIDHCFE